MSHQPGARCCRGQGSEHAVGLGSAERRPGGKAGEGREGFQSDVSIHREVKKTTWLLLILRCLHLSSCRTDSSVSPSHSAGGSEDSHLYKHADKQIHFVTVQSQKTAVYCGCRFAATKSNTNTAEPLETEPESAWNPLGTNESAPPQPPPPPPPCTGTQHSAALLYFL